MPFSEIESRILDMARLRGLISDQDLSELPEAFPDEDTLAWGPKLTALIRAGRITESTLEALTMEVLQTQRGTQQSRYPDDQDSEPVDAAAMPLVWKGYTDLQPIGMGGAGMVYKARDPQLGRNVVLKFPRADLRWKVAQTLREAQAQAQVDHPSVVKVYEVGEHDGQPFIAMQLVLGPTLWDLRKQLTIEQKVRLVAQVAEGVHAAHKLELIHLDIKPGNILVEITDQGDHRPYLADFGLVRKEQDESHANGYGTPPYASPEQSAGEWKQLDRRSDIFSLGVTLYVLLTDAMPFESPSNESAKALVPLRKRDAHFSEDLDAIIGKCLHTNPKDRYASARAFSEDLHRFLMNEPVTAREPKLSYKVSKWFRRHLSIVSIVGTALLLLLALGIRSWWAARRSAEQILLAEQYGQEVKEVEQLLRMAHLSRLHDRRPTVALIKNSLETIQGDMAKLGPNAIGPGSYAMGECHWALEELGQARICLDRAWNSGFRSPSCAQTRGLVLASIYQQARTEIYNEEPEQMRKELARLQRELRDPALECFHVAQKRSFYTPYQNALEAYLKDDLAGAIALTERTGRDLPWLYELDVLGHRLRLEMANALRAKGKTEEANRYYETAGKELEKALEIAPSNPWNWELYGWYSFIMADQPGLTLKGQKNWVERARQSFENALKTEPGHFDAYGGLAQVFRRQSEFAALEGKDPMPYLDRGVNMGEMGFQRTPADQVDTHYTWALIARARERLTHGEDPRSDLDRAIEVLKENLKRSGDFETLSALDTAFMLRGLAAFGWGGDALAYIREAAQWADRASLADITSIRQQTRALGRRVDLAEMELLMGLAPTENLEPTIRKLEDLAKTLSKEPDVLLELAKAQQVKAEQSANVSPDAARASFKKSLESLELAVSIAPREPETYEFLATSTLLYGEWLMSRSENGSAVLQRGMKAVRSLRNLQPRNPSGLVLEVALRHDSTRLARLVAVHPFVARRIQVLLQRVSNRHQG